MKLKIGEAVYSLAALDELTLKTLLKLEQQTQDFGHPLTANDLRIMSDRMRKLKTDDERAADPDALWLTAVTIWASRQIAGEDLTFEQAVDFPMSQLSYIAEPQDHQDPTKPRTPRKGSGGAGKRPAKATQSRTSGPESLAG